MLTTEMQKSGRVQSRNTLQKPLFDRLFCVLALFSSIDLVQKWAAKKNITDKRTTFGPIERPADPVFGHPKRLSARK